MFNSSNDLDDGEKSKDSTLMTFEYPISIDEHKYVCWFSYVPTIEKTKVDFDRVRQEINLETVPSFVIDFDTDENLRNLTPFAKSSDNKLSVQQLRALCIQVSEKVRAVHRSYPNCTFLAEPETKEHIVLYKRWIIPYLQKRGFDYKLLRHFGVDNLFVFREVSGDGTIHWK
ncbi:hypothetical protein [Vibrio sp. CJQ_6]|uniref:hypothetical protein n=1 Tax=Vibrio sp. CJQ_6 TaxID=3367165 RepID=UPI00370B75B7